MLAPFNGYNNLSDTLRKQLEEDRKLAGKVAIYKFYIARKNPDSTNYNGEYIYPAIYSLTPVTFDVTDPGDRLPKKIGMTDGQIKTGTGERDVETKFQRIEIEGQALAILKLDLENEADITKFEYLELHPKFEGGRFRDKNIPALFARVDELKEAKTRLRFKELRSTALMVASRLSEQEVRDFSAAMNWNELEDLDILKDRLTELADKDPDFFKKFIDDPSLEHKAVLRRALDANVIAWIPVENKFTWVSNGATIAMLDRTEGDKYFDKMSDWIVTAKNGAEVFKKIKALLAPIK